MSFNTFSNLYFNKVWVMAITLCTGCASGVMLITPPELETAMNHCEKLRINAESRVKLVKRSEQQGKLNPADSQAIQSAYAETQGLFSQWIDAVQNELSDRELATKTSEATNKSLAQNAADKAKEFTALIDMTLNIVPRGNEIETITSFIKAGSEVIETVKEIDQNKRRELIQKLEDLRWKPYQSII